MRTHSLLARLGLATALVAGTLPTPAFAQTPPDVTFELRPHCEDSDHAAAESFGGEVPEIDGTMTLSQNSALDCPGFEVRDPLSRQTPVLNVGDTLDMDLILHNPSARSITRYRAWIGYDSNALEGVEIEQSDAFPTATPGELDFSIADNYVKLSGTAAQPVTGTMVVVARVTMKVKALPLTATTGLSFYDPNGTPTAHTAAFAGEENVTSTVQGSLVVRTPGGSSSSSSIASVASSAASVPSSAASSIPTASSTPSVASSSVSSVTTPAPTSSLSSAASSASVTTAVGVFSKLQVQSLRVTTEGSSAFLAWNPLPSSELAGYNLYYGSISGRYLQKRSIDASSQTVTVRALPVGQTYYFAVRAVNAQGQESDFSQEVAVSVGNPATSTSPLSGALIEGGPNGNAPGTGGVVSGESGPATWFLLFAVVSAAMGTLLAFRRQWTASSAISR